VLPSVDTGGRDAVVRQVMDSLIDAIIKESMDRYCGAQPFRHG